jgi:soluble lytic murein transglycosylase-like protein
MQRAATFTLAAALLGACWMVGNWIAAQADPYADPSTSNDPTASVGETVMTTITTTLQTWRPPAQYADAIAQAEAANGIPRDLLARQLWQECRYNPAIIDGSRRSPVGAIGIAQFMPATAAQFGIDPTDPFQSIQAAGQYMAQLYARFGTWAQALAAYNWGMGNLSRKGLDQAPQETTRYYTQIIADVNAADGSNIA